MSEKQEAVNRDLLFLMIDREPRFLKRLAAPLLDFNFGIFATPRFNV